jgi:hypothetical protein
VKIVALLALALAAPSAHAAGAVDMTLRCTTGTTGGAPSVGLQAWPRTWNDPYWFPADAYVYAGAAAKLFWVHGALPSFRLDRNSCRPVSAHVPLSPAGLPRVGHVTFRDYPTIKIRCSLPGTILMRFHVQQDARGLPVAASIALRLTKSGTSLAYLTWSWSQVTAWASPRCETTMPSQP